MLSVKKQLFVVESVKGKNVIITGASTGIGEQLAYHYARLGANVVITARREQRLKEVVILKAFSNNKCFSASMNHGMCFLSDFSSFFEVEMQAKVNEAPPRCAQDGPAHHQS